MIRYQRRVEGAPGFVLQQRDGAVVQRGLHELPLPTVLALVQGHHDAQGGIQARHHVDDGQAHAQGRAAGLAVHAHDAAQRLRSSVVPRQTAQGPIGTKAVDPYLNGRG